MGKIFETLNVLGMTSEKTRKIFSEGTRDNENIIVYKDSVSGVIYIDDYHVGNEKYISIDYKKSRPDYERETDCVRRTKDFKGFYIGKRVCDVGCGEGLFLKKIRNLALEVCGVEIQTECKIDLLKNNIECKDSIEEYDKKFETIFMFHSLEHLNDPMMMLNAAKEKLVGGGRLIVEVPHANDFLISHVDCNNFVDFTLWSQHLILHTRESLKRILTYCGYINTVMQGKQRYSLSNHLQWMSKGTPGGHTSVLSVIDTDRLFNEYENVLGGIDATDTLVAISEVS